jgi:hypothetical protein
MENDGKARCQYRNIFPAPHGIFLTLPGLSRIGKGRTSNSKEIIMQVTPATAGPTTAEATAIA